MHIIGFATQFYTLWNYETRNRYTSDSYGNHHQSGVDHVYTYIKNISTDLAKVVSAYPNTAIDDTLRGRDMSFIRSEDIQLPDGYFWRGKYAGKRIDDVIESDFAYCLWVATEYGTPYIKSHPAYIDHINAVEAQRQSQIDSAQTVNVGDVVELEFTTNGYNADDNYTECWAKAMLGDTIVSVLCCGVKPVSGMYPYLMPVINGKAQKTKGKSILVTVKDVIKTSNYGGQIEQHITIL